VGWRAAAMPLLRATKTDLQLSHYAHIFVFTLIVFSALNRQRLFLMLEFMTGGFIQLALAYGVKLDRFIENISPRVIQ